MTVLQNMAIAGAEFSECGKYRYSLWRIWNSHLPKAMCIGLNPSTANANKNDNTINILIGVLGRLGFGGFYMTNLFGWISSEPNDLLIVDDPVGENDYYLGKIREQCDTVIFCWGTFKQTGKRTEIIEHRFPGAKCFGFNQNGTPWHPRALHYKKLLRNPPLETYIQSLNQ